MTRWPWVILQFLFAFPYILLYNTTCLLLLWEWPALFDGAPHCPSVPLRGYGRNALSHSLLIRLMEQQSQCWSFFYLLGHASQKIYLAKWLERAATRIS